MADKWPAATGNWSNAANWNGGTLPQPGDDVYADGKTVTIDQDINVASIRTTQRSGGIVGGVFLLSSSVNITATTITVGGTVDPCMSTQANGLTINITGNIVGGGASTRPVLIMQSISTLNINGNISGNSGIGLQAGAGVTNITGNVTAGTSSNAHGINILVGTGAVVVVTGTVTGGTANGILVTSASASIPSILKVIGTPTGDNAIRVAGFGASAEIISTNNIIGTGSIGVVSAGVSGVSGSGRIKITAPKIVGGNSSTQYAVRVLSASLVLIGNCEASASPALYIENRGIAKIIGNVIGKAANAIEVLANSYGFTVIGDITGGTTGVGVLCQTGVGAICSVVGTVTGGTGASGFGISNTSTADINILGTTVDSTATAISNSSTGVVTITPITEEITMACVELLNVTEDDVSSVQEITGTFDFQANSPEGGTYYLYRALGASVDSEKRDDFQLYKQFNGPANLPIDNTGTNRFKVQLQGTKGVADKVVTVNIQD